MGQKRLSPNKGRRHQFSTGGGGRTEPDWGGGTDSGESKTPTPKFRFLLGFRPLYFGNIGKSKNFSKTVISGGYPSRNRGDTSTASPPVAPSMP